jgi:hypothetical protein
MAIPRYQVGPLVLNNSPPPGAYTPSQLSRAYGFDKISFGSVKGDGAGQTIAIVDAYDHPNIQSDLDIFSAQFGLASTTLTKVNQSGGAAPPTTDSSGGWELETALDVEWAHAMAPAADILLVESDSASFNDLLTAVEYASARANVVSMSWGGDEFSSETFLDSYFDRSGVAFVASSGDTGAPTSYPSASPNVLSVGGTSLHLTANDDYSSESGWSGAGGGPSSYEPRPSYQQGTVTQTTMRADPDVSYDANPGTGFAVYNSFNYKGKSYGWVEVGGTSAGAPQWASLIAIADQGRAVNGLPALNSTDPREMHSILYQNQAAFHDVVAGTSTGSPNYSAAVGYDYVTGLGSPYADRVVAALVGNPIPGLADTLTITAPSTAAAGEWFKFTVSATTPDGAIDTSFRGTVAFSVSDPLGGVPSSYTFTAADNGSHTFRETLRTAGVQTITVTDTAGSAGPATSSGIDVSPAEASKLVISKPPNTTVDTSRYFVVTAKDRYGNVATSYTGTVQLTSTDPSAVITPSTYTFKSWGQGKHTFRVTFETVGPQKVTVTDAALGSTATTLAVIVSPAAPTELTATVSSPSQVDLSWTAAAGADSYTVERRARGHGWAAIATFAAGTTSYSDTGVAAGTTYYYRVQAATGATNSAFSNVAMAITPAAPALVTTNSLWSDSYTPATTSQSKGSYELGLKFSSTVAGTVTGVRFYKQPDMNGYVHVGHLWTSSGTLLATAVFTGETGSGWQEIHFTNPVSISANTTYVISFSTGGGYFGITSNSFQYTSQTGSLRVPVDASVLGPSGFFPRATGAGMNFWADVSFTPNSTPQAVISTDARGTISGMAVLSSGASTISSSGPETTRASTDREDLAAVPTPARGPVNQAPPTSGSFAKPT